MTTGTVGFCWCQVIPLHCNGIDLLNSWNGKPLGNFDFGEATSSENSTGLGACPPSAGLLRRMVMLVVKVIFLLTARSAPNKLRNNTLQTTLLFL